MRLTQIALQNFRNYTQSEVEIDSDLVLILGQNAAGKTNFLESIYFLSRLSSFRAPDPLLIRNQEDFFMIKSQFGDNKFEAGIQIQPTLRRQFKINDLKTKKSFWQSFPVVLFVPNDLNLFQLGPILRRKFLDETLSQVDQSYSLDLESLDHVLKQKSALLEQIYQATAQSFELDFWNQQLVPVALRITEHRQGFVDYINDRLSQTINQLTGFTNQFELRYKRIEPRTEEELAVSLKTHENAEIRSGKNLIGPHRDDLELYKDGQLNLFNSSRGELRTQILALKLLQAEFIGNSGKKPLILLDDVFSELDETRRTKLLENLAGHQIFITTTEEHHLPKMDISSQILKVENNEIK